MTSVYITLARMRPPHPCLSLLVPTSAPKHSFVSRRDRKMLVGHFNVDSPSPVHLLAGQRWALFLGSTPDI
jgi:hypothetical protein